MAKLTKSELKAIFTAGARPTEAQFASLIDSQVNVSETSPSDSIVLLNITASGDISASGTVFADNFQSSGGNNTISFTDDLKLVGDLTSSGNISSSGTIISNIITPTTITNVSTTHVTASGAISASGNLVVGGESTFNDEVTIAKGEKLYFDGPSGMHVYSEGTAPGEDQIIVAKTNNLRILNQAHGKDIEFGTENGSGTAKTPLTLSGSGDATFGGGVTITGTTTFTGAQVGQRLTIKNLTGTSETLTAAESGKLCVFSDADGAIVTLPDSGDGSLIGVYYDFYISVTATSNVHRINVADTTNEDIEGYLHTLDADNATAQATAAWKALNSDGFDAISMNGTTTGIIGTAFRITNIAADRWYVTGHIVATGIPATPFVAS